VLAVLGARLLRAQHALRAVAVRDLRAGHRGRAGDRGRRDRRAQPRAAHVGPVRARPTIPLEVLSAAVREAFAEIDPVEPDAITDDAVIVAAGALVMAVAVAHEPAASAIPPPWEMTHPALLDPVIWALATAYQLG
jgi:hypothetical protein